MSNKIDRHKFIRQIIASGRIANQNELRDVLESQGFATTQATLSRDLMALRIIKVPDAEKDIFMRFRRIIKTLRLRLKETHPCKPAGR
jgi:arginine repressor